MTITETTPRQRTFIVEFTENELKVIGIICGWTPQNKIEQMLEYNTDGIDIPSPTKEHYYTFGSDFYHKVSEIFKS